jgi:hypothetical protein
MQRYLTLDDTRKYWFSNYIIFTKQNLKNIDKVISCIFVMKFREYFLVIKNEN